jgi:hypothetical protein
MRMENIQKWYQIFNFNLNDLSYSGTSAVMILLIQIIWIIIILYMIIKKKNFKYISINLFSFLFSGVLSMYYNYINKYTTTVLGYNDLLKYTFDDVLYGMKKWMVFFTYELFLCFFIFLLFLYIVFFVVKDTTNKQARAPSKVPVSGTFKAPVFMSKKVIQIR